MEIVLPGLGLLLVALLTVDVFRTVFHPVGRGGPLTHRLAQGVWAGYRRAGRRADGSPRAERLTYAGPVIVVLTILAWVVLLTVGFALVVYPWIRSYLVSPGSLRVPWAEALYVSGYTASTLGFGDVVPDRESLRLLTVVEAFGGFALLSASLTYFLAVYRELVRMESLAASVSGLFSEGEARVLEFGREEGTEALARWCERLSSELSTVRLAHYQYPVLHYFRPAERGRSVPVQLGALLRFCRGVAGAEPGTPLARLARHPSFGALRQGVGEYLREVDRYFVPADFRDHARREGGRGAEKSKGGELERIHARLLRYMLEPE